MIVITGCSPFEVFYGRVSNCDFHPLLTVEDDGTVQDGSLSESDCEGFSVSTVL